MRRWIVYSLITVTMYGLWGFLAVFTGPDYYDIPFLVVCAAMAAGLVPTLIPPLFSGERWSGTNPLRGATISLVAGLVATVANFGPYAALQNGGPAIVVIPMTAAYPILTAVAAVVLLRERLSLIQVLGIIIGVTGAVLLTATSSGDPTLSILAAFEGAIRERWFWWTILNLVGQAVLGLLYKLSSNDLSPEGSFVLFGLSFSLCSTLIFVADFVFIQQLPWRLGPGEWGICIGLGMTMGFGILAQIAACRHGKAALVTALTGLYPAVTTAMIVFLLGVPLSRIALFGITSVLIGAVAMTHATRASIDRCVQVDCKL